MPEELERKLRAEADKKGFTGERADRYVYGAMRATGWKPEREQRKTIKGLKKRQGRHA